MHHDPAHFDLLLTSTANYLLPIVMWALIGNRRSTSTHLWCLGQWILAGLLLAIGINDAIGGIESRIGFLVISVAFIFCTQALQMELGKKRDLKIPAFFAIAVYPCFELIRQFGQGALNIAFIQFVYASWLCYLAFLAFSIYKQKNIASAKWLAYAYIPALLGMLQLSSLEGLHAYAFYHYTHEHFVLCGLLLSAVISQFVYMAMSFELHWANTVNVKSIPHDLSSGNSPEKNMLLSQIARSDEAMSGMKLQVKRRSLRGRFTVITCSLTGGKNDR